MEKESIDWNDPDIPVQFFALRREVIRLNLLLEALSKAVKQPMAIKGIEAPGSKRRATAWKEILERHRQAIEQEGS